MGIRQSVVEWGERKADLHTNRLMGNHILMVEAFKKDPLPRAIGRTATVFGNLVMIGVAERIESLFTPEPELDKAYEKQAARSIKVIRQQQRINIGESQ